MNALQMLAPVRAQKKDWLIAIKHSLLIDAPKIFYAVVLVSV